MPKATRDPNDPDFPHGEVRGFRRGCRCESCRAAKRAKNLQYRQEVKAVRPGASPLTDQVAPDRAARRVRELVRTYSINDISRVTGVNVGSIRRLRDGRPKFITRLTERAVLNAKFDRIAPSFVSPALLLQRLGSLAALGYPFNWQMRQAGLVQTSLTDIREASFIRRETFQRYNVVYEKYGVRHARPEDGISQHSMVMAKKWARHHRYYPPAAYDDEGNLIAEAVRVQRKEVRKDRRTRAAMQRIDALWRSLAGESASHIEAMTDINARTVNRWRDEAGLRFGNRDADTDLIMVAPGYEERAEEIRVALASYRDDPLADPFEVLCKLGIMSEGRWAHLDVASTDRPNDHSTDPVAGQANEEPADQEDQAA